MPTQAEMPSPGTELPAPAPVNAAVIVVKLPAEAELWFDGIKTAQGGSYRLLVTPPLPNGHEASYTLRAHWLLKGVELDRSEQVRVRPGERFTVNFLTSDGWTQRKRQAAD
jgi:uncharacterized protein (TIGR03000 family)